MQVTRDGSVHDIEHSDRNAKAVMFQFEQCVQVKRKHDVSGVVKEISPVLR